MRQQVIRGRLWVGVGLRHDFRLLVHRLDERPQTAYHAAHLGVAFLVDEGSILELCGHSVEFTANDRPGEGGDMSVAVSLAVGFTVGNNVQGHHVSLVAVLEVDCGRTTVGGWLWQVGLPLQVWGVQIPWVAGLEMLVQLLLGSVAAPTAMTVLDPCSGPGGPSVPSAVAGLPFRVVFPLVLLQL